MDIEEDKILENGHSIALEEVEEDDTQISKVAAHVVSSWQRSRDNRAPTESRWLTSYDNFRGKWKSPFLTTEKSKVFIKITKTKALAQYGQVLNILSGNANDIPIAIEPTPIPLDTTDAAHIDIEEQGPSAEEIDVIGFEGDGQGVVEGEGLTARAARIIGNVFQGAKAKEGKASNKEQIQINPAQEAADLATKAIQDQLAESNMGVYIRRSILESIILGTGCIKGPFLFDKEYARWTEEGEYDPIFLTMPKSYQASVWNIYPDPDADSTEDMQWVIERHRWNKRDLLDKKGQPFFIDDQISLAVERGTNYKDEHWELRIREGNDQSTHNRYEVLEYWGSMDISDLLEIDGFEEQLPEGFDEDGVVDVNIFVCNGAVLRAVINPFKPNRIPYILFPYEEDPYNIFGVSLPENMEDSQTLMNGFTRMAVDNLALAGNIMLEVDEDNLAPGTDMSIYAGKVWRKQQGQTGQTVHAIKFPSTANENLQMYDKFRVLADETTGIPSFSHGQTGVSGIGRTAAGISMLLGAASINTKTFIKNLDDYLFEPLGKSYFAWNMQFNFNKAWANGDLEVKPLGVSSLIQKEVLSQRLLQFMQVAMSNPITAAKVNEDYVLEEFARTLDLDPNKVILDPKEAALKLKLMGEAGRLSSQPQGQQAGPPSPFDETGGANGNIGVGTAPPPGTDTFTG